MCEEKRSDELWLVVKRLSNLAIAGSPRNISRYDLYVLSHRGRDTGRGWGAQAYPLLPNSECGDGAYGVSVMGKSRGTKG